MKRSIFALAMSTALGLLIFSASTALAQDKKNQLSIAWELDCDLCEEEDVSRPPTGGECIVEVTWESTKFVSGQGISEGRGEISTMMTVVTNTGITTVFSPERKFSVGEEHYEGLALGTFTVPAGQQETIYVRTDFTEYDKGLNGHDDHAKASTKVQLICDPQDGTKTELITIGPADFCGPNVCLGSAEAELKVMREDADGDGVANPKDFTPEPCDEANKGKEGVALLLYFNFNDSGLLRLFQSAGTNISKHFGAYDYVVLVMDNEVSNLLGTSGNAFKDADIVFEPTREGLMDAMQHLTAKGYRFDTFFLAHGIRYNTADSKYLTDSKIETLDGPYITGDKLLALTEPDKIGTPRGGIPIIAASGVVCWMARMIDVWKDMGAVVSSGAINWNFYPQSQTTFMDDWVVGTPYRTAVDNSVTLSVMAASQTFISAQAILPPFLCVQALGLQATPSDPCFGNFFNDSTGLEAKYDLDATYDCSVSGAANMVLSSEREFIGNETVVFGGGPGTRPDLAARALVPPGESSCPSLQSVKREGADRTASARTLTFYVLRCC